jgi:CHAD domain-containing protein
VKSHSEIDLKFLVPSAACVAVAAELARGASTIESSSSTGQSLDQAEVRRTVRKIRTNGAVVEVAFEEGRLVAAGASQRLRELEFRLASGATAPMLALAEKWRKRFGLIYDPRSKAERGDPLARGAAFPPVRRAGRLAYGDHATASEVFGVAIDECLAQITRNAIGVADGDPALRAEHVHQLRIGIRRLRSALRSFQGWVPAPPAVLVDGLKSLFATLGRSRDSDVLSSGVMAELAKACAPPLTLPVADAGPGAIDSVRAGETQRTILAWIAWRAALARKPDDATGREQVKPDGAPAGCGDAPTFHRKLERRLRRWHGRIVAAWNAFETLDDAGLHALRKRIKRQRYALEFFTPVLRRRKVERYLDALTAIQDRLGELNDLLVARARHQALVPDPAAWFALGWLAARIAEVRSLAGPELRRLAKMDAPAN